MNRFYDSLKKMRSQTQQNLIHLSFSFYEIVILKGYIIMVQWKCLFCDHSFYGDRRNGKPFNTRMQDLEFKPNNLKGKSSKATIGATVAPVLNIEPMTSL